MLPRRECLASQTFRLCEVSTQERSFRPQVLERVRSASPNAHGVNNQTIKILRKEDDQTLRRVGQI